MTTFNDLLKLEVYPYANCHKCGELVHLDNLYDFRRVARTIGICNKCAINHAHAMEIAEEIANSYGQCTSQIIPKMDVTY